MEKTIEGIWKERSQNFYREMIHYWRLIGSSGLSLTVIILLILGILFYEDFLTLIPENFPIALILSLLLGFLIVKSSHRTLLKEADILFLIPLESKMERYFQHSFAYNLFIQSLGLLIILLLFSPLYANKISMNTYPLWLYFILPLILKGWNVSTSWIVLRIQDERVVTLHVWCRYVFYVLFLYWFFTEGNLGWLVVFSMVVFAFYFFNKKVKEEYGYNWLHLIEMEKRLEGRFYTFANAFVDVPHLQSQVKRRVILSAITKWLPFNQSHAYRYLYLKTFFRSNNYFWIYVRLSIIGAVLVTYIPEFYGQLIAYVLFLYLTSIQLKIIWGHHQRQFWFKLFPLPTSQLKTAYLWLHSLLLTIQSGIMVLPILILEFSTKSLTLLGIGVLFVYSYSFLFLKRRTE
jgi:ABC-2 type transport system permease protein